MAENYKTLDFDAVKEPATRDFVRSFFEHSWEVQRAKNEEFVRIYQMYKTYQDMTGRDPARSNIVIPKLYALVETLMPEYVEALLGIRPYIPIELFGAGSKDIAQAQTDLLDAFLHDSDFYWEIVKLIKYALLYGTSFIESTPDTVSRKVRRREPILSQDYYGNVVPVGFSESVETVVEFLLRTRTFAPWEIWRDPNATTIDGCRGLIKWRGRISGRQLKKMAERNPEMWPNFDPDKLDFDMQELEKDDIARKMMTTIGVPRAKDDTDLGIWLSYESGDRYIDMWNFSTVMRDIPNPYDHGKINLTRVINTDDPNPDNSWYGIGEGRPIEPLCKALDVNYRQMFDNHNMLGHVVLFYDNEAMNVDQLVMVAGNRIPVDLGANKTIQDHVWERPTPVLSPDFYKVPAVVNNIIDETSGVHEPMRGQPASHEQTAREAMLLQQRGGNRLRLKIRLGENMGLKGYAEKSVAIIDQFASFDDVVRKIGLERAMMLPTMNPAEVDGGYEFAFKGSNRMLQSAQKRQDSKDIYQLMAGNFSVRQDWLSNFLLETHDVSEKERRRAVVPDLQAMQMQMIMAQAQAQASGGAETTRLVSNGSAVGGSAGNTPTGRDQNEKLGTG